MDNILGLLVQRASVLDNLEQQLLFIVSLLALHLAQLSVYVTLSITCPVLDILYIVYTEIKPDVYSTLVATLPNTCENLFFFILHTLDVTATTLWSWPQLPPQQESASVLSAIKLAYKTVRGHSISSGDAKKLYLWLPETLSRRLVSRECYHRSLSPVSGIPLFKLPFVVDILSSKRISGQSLDYVLARLPNAVSSLIHDEICEEVYSRHATALATIVVSLGFILFILSLFKLRNHMFFIITNGLVSLQHFALFPIRFLVNRYQRVQQPARLFQNSETQTEDEEAHPEPEIGNVLAAQVQSVSVQTEDIISIDKEEKSSGCYQDSTRLTGSIRDGSSVECVIETNSPTITNSVEDVKNTSKTDAVVESTATTSDRQHVSVSTEGTQPIPVYTEERDSTPSDLQPIQVYTGVTPSRPPKHFGKRTPFSFEPSAPWMSSQWNTNKFGSMSPQPGAMFGHRGSRHQTVRPADSFFANGTSSLSPSTSKPAVPQYFNSFSVSPGPLAYTTPQQQFLPIVPSNVFAESTPSRNIIHDTNASQARSSDSDPIGSTTVPSPAQPSPDRNESDNSETSNNTTTDSVVVPPAATKPSDVTDQPGEDEVFVYPDGVNASTGKDGTIQAQFSAEDSTNQKEPTNTEATTDIIALEEDDSSPALNDEPASTSTNSQSITPEQSRMGGGVWSSMHAPAQDQAGTSEQVLSVPTGGADQEEEALEEAYRLLKASRSKPGKNKKKKRH